MNSDSLLKGWTSLFFSVPQYWRHSEINCACWVPGPSSQYLTDGSVCNSASYQETSPCVTKSIVGNCLHLARTLEKSIVVARSFNCARKDPWW
jgi:hypothetical protein